MSNSLTEVQSSPFSDKDGEYGNDFSSEELKAVEALQAMYLDGEIVAPYIPEMIVKQSLEWFVDQLHEWLHDQIDAGEKVLIIYNLKGAEYFWIDIQRVWIEKFSCHLDAMAEAKPVRVSTSVGEKEFGEVNEELLKWEIDPRGKTVVSLDDIGDRGDTQQAIVKKLKDGGAKEVIVVNLTEKDVDKSFEADAFLLWVVNEFLLGRGLDSGTNDSELEDAQRNLKTIVQLQ